MQLIKPQLRRMHKAYVLGTLLALTSADGLLAQTPSNLPSQSKVGTGGVFTSAPLLQSPLLSPEAKARINQERISEDKAYAVVKLGDEFAKNDDWPGAQNAYQQTLEIAPRGMVAYKKALYGLIACCRATGDTAKGLAYSRQAIYRHGSAAEGYNENDVEQLMQFAILLNKSGQSSEAVSAYNRATAILDYQDSIFSGGPLQPHLRVLLPEITSASVSANQVQYTPEHLQALADTALSHEERGSGSDKEAMAHMQEAVKLYPDSAVTYYYLGEAFPKRTPEQKAAYQKAAELGDDATVAAAKERLAPFR